MGTTISFNPRDYTNQYVKAKQARNNRAKELRQAGYNVHCWQRDGIYYLTCYS